MIRNMKDRGMSNREIANELGISRNTVRKMIKATGTPEPKRRKRGSKLDPYRQGIRELIEKYNLSSIRILGEIRKPGFDGGIQYLRLTALNCGRIARNRDIQV